MARVQVEGLRSRAPTAPTARVVDTFVQPQAPDTTPSRAAVIADALGQVAPGVISKTSEKRRKEELLRAEKAYLMDGMASDIASVANGEKYAQESKVFLRHYKELRTRGYVQQQLNMFGSDLLEGRLTNPDGTPLLVDNVDDYNKITNEKVSELVSQIDDPLTMDVVSPAIREWTHNTGVSWHAQLNKKLNTDRDRAYIDVVNEHLPRIREVGINGLSTILSQEADEFYALTKNGKSTELVVDQLVAAMENSGDFAFGDVALRMTQGGKPLSQTLKDKVIDAKEALQAQIDADAKARQTAKNAQDKADRIVVENKVLDGLLNPGNLNNPRAVIQQQEAAYAAIGGKKEDLYKLLNTVNTVTGFKTPMMEANLTNFQTQVLRYASSPNQDITPREYALALITDEANAGKIHPQDIPTLLSFAQSAQQSATVLANTEVNKYRKSAVESTLGTVALTQSMKPHEKKEMYQIEQAFDERFQIAYAEAYAADGSVTQAEIRQIAQNVTNELISDKEQLDELQAEQFDVSQESLSSVRYPGEVFGTNSIEEIEDIRVLIPQGMTESDLYEIFTNEILNDPRGIHQGSNLPKWKAFESRTFPGAFAYFYDIHSRQ